MQTIIVSRHLAVKDWIAKHHPEFKNVKVLAHAKPEDIKGTIVIGVLPVNLAALCGEYWALDMNIPEEFRGKELFVEDMEKFGCAISRYRIYNNTQYMEHLKHLKTISEFMDVEYEWGM